jgi:DNA-binding transcriptional LysR family regulator
MDLRQLQTFVTVADLGTVTLASQRLHLSQPALSRQIADLEEALKVQLFDRVGRRLVLSSAGQQLLGDCRGLLGASRALVDRAASLRSGDTGVLRVGLSPQQMESVVSAFLPMYAEAHPRVTVQVMEGNGSEVLRWLEEGDIDLAGALPHGIQVDPSRYGQRELATVDLLAASHPAKFLGNAGEIEVASVAKLPLLLLGTDFGFRRAFDAACGLAGVQCDVRFESRSPHTLMALAEAGHGVAVIPSALRSDRYAVRIQAITYRGQRLRERLTILWDKRRTLPPFAVAFCDLWARHAQRVVSVTRPTGDAAARTTAVESTHDVARSRKRK